MDAFLDNFLLIFICVLVFGFIVFLIAFLILEFLSRSKRIDKYVNEKTIKDLVKKFHKKLDIASSQDSKEILECLKDFDDLDSVFYVIKDSNYDFMSEEKYLEVKNDILNNIIQEKINNIEKYSRKKEKYRALFDEINVCQARYPLYKNVYFNNLQLIKNKI